MALALCSPLRNVAKVVGYLRMASFGILGNCISKFNFGILPYIRKLAGKFVAECGQLFRQNVTQASLSGQFFPLLFT